MGIPFNPFKFTNKWAPKYMNATQPDRIDVGLFGDWSDKDISARLRVGKCVLFSVGFNWSPEIIEAYVCVLNFQIGLKYTYPKEEAVVIEE